jgi:hypothetical protein
MLPEEQCRSVPNDADGWAALVEPLRNFSIAAIGLKASAATSVVLHVRCSQEGSRCGVAGVARCYPICDGLFADASLY